MKSKFEAIVVNFMTKSGKCGKLVPLVILVLLPEVLYLYLDKKEGDGERGLIKRK